MMIEVGLPALLFVALAPGLLLDVDVSRVQKGLGKVVKVGTMKTYVGAVFTHAVVYALLLDQLRKLLGKVDTKMSNVIMPTVLSVVLSPGMLLTVEPSKMKVGFMDGKTSVESVLVHAVVLAVVYGGLRQSFPDVY